MTKLTSTILGLALLAAFSASEADASPPVLVHNGVPVPTAPAYGNADHSWQFYGRNRTSRYGTRVRSPYSYGYNSLSRYPSQQCLNRSYGYGTTGYGTSRYGDPASGYNGLGHGTPGHGGLNRGAFYGSY